MDFSKADFSYCISKREKFSNTKRSSTENNNLKNIQILFSEYIQETSRKSFIWNVSIWIPVLSKEFCSLKSGASEVSSNSMILRSRQLVMVSPARIINYTKS